MFYIYAILQWLIMAPVMYLGVLITYFVSPLVILTAKPLPQPQGKPSTSNHSNQYVAMGSSGKWQYLMTDVPVLRWFGNLEDGLLGEPSGKYSASVNGKERKFINKLMWVWRNPFNYAKRNSKLLACYVNDCTVTYKGDYDVNDKVRYGGGSFFVMAKRNNWEMFTWPVYYGYRKVFVWDDVYIYSKLTKFISKVFGIKHSVFRDRVCNITFGYKIKPSHRDHVQDNDDLDKALTFRIQLAKKGEWVTKK